MRSFRVNPPRLTNTEKYGEKRYGRTASLGVGEVPLGAARCLARIGVLRTKEQRRVGKGPCLTDAAR
jgi:hypothetical protein